MRDKETGTDQISAAKRFKCKPSVLLAFVTEGQGLVLTGPLLAVICDWGRESSKIKTLRLGTN